MKVQRTIPPAAAPLSARDLVHGIAGALFPNAYEPRLRRELREYFGVPHVFLLSSGKAALTVILRALHSLAPHRREVVIPAYTCFSVPSAVVKAGLTVRLCDIDPDTFNPDPSLLPAVLNGQTLCVVSNHLFGIPSDIDAIARLCAGRGIYVVEDAAQAMGGRSPNRKLGTIGDAGFFSFGRGKNITCGSGGLIVTRSDRIAAAVQQQYDALRQASAGEQLSGLIKALLLALFLEPRFYWFPAGLPFLRLGETFFYTNFKIERLAGLHAGLLRRWRERLERSNRTRRENACFLCRSLGLDNRKEAPYLRLPVLARDQAARDGICAGSREQGLGISRMYPSGVDGIGEIAHLFTNRSYPAASAVAERLFTLPTHELLTNRDRDRIVRFVKMYLSGA